MSNQGFRLPDAEARLQALVARRLVEPFVWGRFDCGLFAAEAAEAVCGTDPAGDLRGRYACALGAARRLREALGAPAEGRSLLQAYAQQRFGAEVLPTLALPGDVGLSYQQGQALLAVCVGSQWLAPGPAGLEPIVGTPARAWRAAPCLKS